MGIFKKNLNRVSDSYTRFGDFCTSLGLTERKGAANLPDMTCVPIGHQKKDVKSGYKIL